MELLLPLLECFGVTAIVASRIPGIYTISEDTCG